MRKRRETETQGLGNGRVHEKEERLRHRYGEWKST